MPVPAPRPPIPTQLTHAEWRGGGLACGTGSHTVPIAEHLGAVLRR
jgi:hypothetical protein